MEWSNQITEFQRTWVKQQQKLLTDWIGILQGTGTGTPQNVWQAVDIMEQQVNSALDVQKQSLMALAENAEHVEGVPEAFTQWIHQLEGGIEMWNEVQQRLWQAWFDMLRTTAPEVQTPDEILVRNWQEMARRAMSIQEQWLSSWTGLQTVASGKTGNKTMKSSSSRRPTRSTGKKANKGDI